MHYIKTLEVIIMQGFFFVSVEILDSVTGCKQMNIIDKLENYYNEMLKI